MALIPDLVNNSKLETRFHPDYTLHIQYRSGNTFSERRTRVEERWKREQELGRGGFGRVYLERCITGEGDSSPTVRAVKTLPKTNVSDLYKELEAIALFSHQKYRHCFVESFGWYDDRDRIFITMEYIPQGDLKNYMTKPFPEVEARTIGSQLLEGLAYMHQNHFAHRDLKPQNILVKCQGPSWWIKIADFGISKRVNAASSAMKTVAGTPAYLAPEVLGFTKVTESRGCDTYTNAVDIWSFGAVMFQLLTATVPFPDLRLLAQFAAQHIKFPEDPLRVRQVSRQAHDLILDTMIVNPAQRASASDLLKHSWILKGANTNTLLQRRDTTRLTQQFDNLQIARFDTAEISPETAKGASAAWTTLQTDSSTVEMFQASTFTAVAQRIAPTGILGKKSDPVDPNTAFVEMASDMVAQGNQLLEKSQPSEAEICFQMAVNTYRRVVSTDDVESGAIMTLLGVAQLVQKKWLAAEKSLQEAIEIIRRQNEDQCDYRMCTLIALGQSQYMQSDQRGAQRSLEEAKDLYQAEYDMDFELISLGLFLLSSIQMEQDELSSAEQTCRKALDICQKRGYEDHKMIANIMMSLGVTQIKQGKDSAAEDSLETSVRHFTRNPDYHPENLANTLYLLGCVQEVQAKHSLAETSLEKAIAIFERVRSCENDKIPTLLHQLGKLQHEQEKNIEAERSFQKAVEAWKKISGDHDWKLAESLHWLGFMQTSNGKHFEGEVSFQEAVNIRERLGGYSHEDTLESLECLVQPQIGQGKHAAAEETMQIVIDIRKKVFGESHETLAFAMYMLGKAQLAQDKFQLAEKTLEAATNIRMVTIDHKDDTEADIWFLLGRAQLSQNKYQKSEISLHRAYTIQKEKLTYTHVRTIEILYSLGCAQLDQNKYMDAERSFRDEFVLRERMVPDDTANNAVTLRWLAMAQAEQGKLTEARNSLLTAYNHCNDSLGPRDAATIDTKAELRDIQDRIQRQQRSASDAVMMRSRGQQNGLGTHQPASGARRSVNR